MHKGEHFAQLRKDRGLTQQDVADDAGRSVQTVRGLEGRADYSTSAKTLLQLLSVLDRAKPLTTSEAAIFGDAYGADVFSMLPAQRRAVKMRSVLASAAAPDFNTAENRLLMSISQLDEDERRVFDELLDLIDTFGAEQSLRMMRALRTIASPASHAQHAQPPEPTRVLTHVSPPIKRPDGAIEEVHTDIAVPAKPAVKPAPKQRKEA